MSKLFTVAKWEFIEKVKSKAFLISLLLMPLIVVGMGVLPGLLASKEDDRTLAIGVIDETGALAGPLAQRIEEKYRNEVGQPQYLVRNLGTDGGSDLRRAEAVRLLSEDQLEGFLVIPSEVRDSGQVIYRARNVGNFRIQERFSRTIEELITEQRMSAEGLDVRRIRELTADISLRSIKVDEKGEESETGFLQTFFTSYIALMMLMFMVMTSGQLLIRSVVEEKQNRVIEVLLSSCSPRDLMAGKILGLSGLGLVQLGLWALGLIAVMLKTGQLVAAPDVMLLTLAYFLLGYMLYAGIFVAAGAPVTTEQEAQQITSYVSLMLVFPIVLAVPAMQNPDATYIRVLSFIPLLTPAFMVLRMPIQMPPTWEIGATLGLLALSAVGMMWVAGKIFRIAILVYGKRPSFRQLWMWAREG
ncbi:MAG: ABC transporter permease [Bacteroidetes bacterium]|jgi:ABC-2 type transport system permease protein|nr:ABC transporter permease [Bacteroidota bacterium]